MNKFLIGLAILAGVVLAYRILKAIFFKKEQSDDLTCPTCKEVPREGSYREKNKWFPIKGEPTNKKIEGGYIRTSWKEHHVCLRCQTEFVITNGFEN